MFSRINKIEKSLNQEKIGPIFFITPNPNRAIGIEREIDDYHVICSQNTDLCDSLKKEKISILCINDEEIKNSGKLLENKKVIDYIRKKSKNGRANILTFKPSPKISKICIDNDFHYLGNSWNLNRDFEDKIKFVEITKNLKIPNANSKIIDFQKEKTFENISRRLKKENLIFQLSRGFSGNSTFLIEGEKELNEIIKKYQDRRFKVSKYLEGNTYTINACVTKFGIAISQPIFQITGLIDYNKNKFGTSGNDYSYSEELNNIEKKKIFNYTKKIGKYMAKLGYRGVFGLDFIVNKNEVDLIEINPRFVGSIPVFTKLQIQREEIPFVLFHIMEFLEIDYSSKSLEDYISFESWNKRNNFNFSQLILRNTKNVPIKIEKTIISGVYKIEKNELILKNNNYFSKDLTENEILIQAAKKESLINPDTEYANLQFGRSIIEKNKLNGNLLLVINSIVSRFGL